VPTGHHNNVFAAKFTPRCNDTLVTTAADGEVRLVNLRGDSAASVECLLRHRSTGMGMKVTFLPLHPHSFLSTHQDGRVRLFDLRSPRPAASATHGVVVALPDASGSASDLVFDPAQPNLFALGCNDPTVRLFDVRRLGEGAGAACARPLAQLLPPPVAAQLRVGGAMARALDGVSGLAWAPHSRLAASYRGADVYAFDCRAAADAVARAQAFERPAEAVSSDAAGTTDAEAEEEQRPPPPDVRFLRRFTGRHNVRTFLKGLASLARGAYLAAGGDCGCVYVWHAASGALAARLEGDSQVLNCVAAHPDGLPLLAVSGIDSDVKIIGPCWEEGLARARPRLPRGEALQALQDPLYWASAVGGWDAETAAAAAAAAREARAAEMQALLRHHLGHMGDFAELFGQLEEEEEEEEDDGEEEDEDEEGEEEEVEDSLMTSFESSGSDGEGDDVAELESAE